MVNIFQFLEKTKGKPIPFEFKLLNNLPINDTNLIYDGDLDLEDFNIVALPDNLTVNGYLDLYKSKIKSLPNNLTVNGELNISYTKISDLPKNLYIGGNFYCYKTPLAERFKKENFFLEEYDKKVKGLIYYG